MKTVVLTLLFAVLLSFPLRGASQFSWRTDFDAALVESQQTSKPIFVDVYADWCEWCHKLDRDVYSKANFAKYMDNFIPVKIDAEDSKEGTRFAEKYHIDSFPTMLVIDSNGKIINRISGYLSVEELIQDISMVQHLVNQERKNPEDATISLKLGKEYSTREMYDEAEIRFRDVLNSPDATRNQKESAQFSLGLAQYYERDLKDSLASLEAYYKTYSQGESREDALLLLSQVHIELDSNEKARTILKEFLAQYPNSGNIARAQQVLSLIEKDLSKAQH
jgi:thioredoxin-related protein